MDVLHLPGEGGDRRAVLATDGDRFVATDDGALVCWRVVRGSGGATLQREVPRLDAVHGCAVSDGGLAAVDRAGALHVWRRSEGGWQALGPRLTPTDPGAEPADFGAPGRLVLAPSGRFLLLESAPIDTGPHTWPVARAVLLDLERDRVMGWWDLHKTWIRAGFGSLADGREALFVSAASYMGVKVVACASGEVLLDFEPTGPHAFCHTDYALLAGGRWLWTFGCVWAAPYEARIYDAGALLAGAPRRVRGRFEPAAPIARHEEAFVGADIVLPRAPRPARDGAVSTAAYVDLGGLPAPGSEDEDDLLTDQDADLVSHYRQLCTLRDAGHEAALLVRRLDLDGGADGSSVVAPVHATDERCIHLLADHRVVLINRAVQRIDGTTGAVEQLDCDPPDIAHRALPTADGRALVCW